MDHRIVCPNCSHIVPAGSSFCPKCGCPTNDDEKTVHVIPPGYSAYLPTGTVLQGKYRINHVLGQGGFGITYDGTDLKLQMHIAIKEYFPRQVAERFSGNTYNVTCTQSAQIMYEQGMQNFLKEARNMAKFVGQEHFISVHDYFVENNTAYIIMEYVEGQNLKDYMKQHGRLSMDSALRIIAPVMEAVEKIHSAGMIHRDISPSNIMVQPRGNIKLLDFGSVRDISQETQTLTSMSAVYKKGYCW
ncbi:MAG: serine/threonine-protein kinase [Lachnospiraceae bacterium]|nr:serine/threonine-protein kinase [Lachnospiraceae bacterium]